MSIWAFGFEPRWDATPQQERKRPSLRRQFATIGGIAAGVGLGAAALQAARRKRSVSVTHQPGGVRVRYRSGGGAPAGSSHIPNDTPEEFRRKFNDKNHVWEI